MAGMSDVLRKTLNGLRALAADHRSGAAEITDHAVALLEDFCRLSRPRDPRLPYALSELADALLTIEPAMAPLLNLANQIQLAAESRDGGTRSLPRVQSVLKKWRRQREHAPSRIARLFAARLPRRATILTYSYSSTVLAALRAVTRRLDRVILSEGRPLYEGRLMAERLAAAGLRVTLIIDAALPEQVAAADVVVVGADAVLAQAYFNKVGTRQVQEKARRGGKPFFILADTTKLLPPLLEPFHRIEERAGRELWREAPTSITLVNRNFERIPLEPGVALLCERGVLPPARLRTWVKRLPVARRWRESQRPEAA